MRVPSIINIKIQLCWKTQFKARHILKLCFLENEASKRKIIYIYINRVLITYNARIVNYKYQNRIMLKNSIQSSTHSQTLLSRKWGLEEENYILHLSFVFTNRMISQQLITPSQELTKFKCTCPINFQTWFFSKTARFQKSVQKSMQRDRFE